MSVKQNTSRRRFLKGATATATASIRFGPGVTREVGMDLAHMGVERAMVVTDPNLGKDVRRARSFRTQCVSAFHFALTVVCVAPCLAETYPIVDTGQERCYDNRREIKYPKAGERFFGQDAQYPGTRAAYRDNGDGTITDLVTGLMWQKDPGPKKRTFQEAVDGASACGIGGYDDWRLPSIKELYSLILFSGEDVDPHSADTSDLKPFINTDYFGFVYGDPAKGERIIDSQMATSTKYVSTTMRGNETMFGVNFADGRIKGYPAGSGRPGRPSKKYTVFYVRGTTQYGKNDFHDNGDGTIADRATGLTWAKLDSGHLKAGENKDGKLNWEQALRWAEDLEYAGHFDWRLPNAKELQSIVDYTRSPDTTQSAAIDPIFSVTPIRDALGKVNYPFYWSSTTHKRMGGGEAAVYVAFGRSQGWMPGFQGHYNLLDVHGAGSQRSDPKAGDPSQFPRGRGPQGDLICIYNRVRPVRGGVANVRQSGPELEPQRAGRRPGGPGPGGRLDSDQTGPARRGPGRMGRGPIDPRRRAPPIRWAAILRDSSIDWTATVTATCPGRSSMDPPGHSITSTATATAPSPKTKHRRARRRDTARAAGGDGQVAGGVDHAARSGRAANPTGRTAVKPALRHGARR